MAQKRQGISDFRRNTKAISTKGRLAKGLMKNASYNNGIRRSERLAKGLMKNGSYNNGIRRSKLLAMAAIGKLWPAKKSSKRGRPGMGYIKVGSPPGKTSKVRSSPKLAGKVGRPPKGTRKVRQPAKGTMMVRQPKVGLHAEKISRVRLHAKETSKVGLHDKETRNVRRPVKKSSRVGPRSKRTSKVRTLPKGTTKVGRPAKGTSKVRPLPKETTELGRPPVRTGKVGTPPKRTRKEGTPPKRTRKVGRSPRITMKVGRTPKITTKVRTLPKGTKLGGPPMETRKVGRPPKGTRKVGRPPKGTSKAGARPKETSKLRRPSKANSKVVSPPSRTSKVRPTPKIAGKVRRSPKETRKVRRHVKGTRVVRQPNETGKRGRHAKRSNKVGPKRSNRMRPFPKVISKLRLLPKETTKAGKPPMGTRKVGRSLKGLGNTSKATVKSSDRIYLNGVPYWKATRILDHTWVNGQEYYKVAWMKWEPNWEPARLVIEDAKELVEHYERSFEGGMETEGPAFVYCRSEFSGYHDLASSSLAAPSTSHQTGRESSTVGAKPVSVKLTRLSLEDLLKHTRRGSETEDGIVTSADGQGQCAVNGREMELVEGIEDIPIVSTPQLGVHQQSSSIAGASNMASRGAKQNESTSQGSSLTPNMVLAYPSTHSQVLPNLRLDESADLVRRFRLEHEKLVPLVFDDGRNLFECECGTILQNQTDHALHKQEVALFLKIVDAVQVKKDLSLLSKEELIKGFRGLQIQTERDRLHRILFKRQAIIFQCPHGRRGTRPQTGSEGRGENRTLQERLKMIEDDVRKLRHETAAQQQNSS